MKKNNKFNPFHGSQSEFAKIAHFKTRAGEHSDKRGLYGKDARMRNRQEERRAKLHLQD